MSFMYSIYNLGPSKEPCGTPQVPFILFFKNLLYSTFFFPNFPLFHYPLCYPRLIQICLLPCEFSLCNEMKVKVNVRMQLQIKH